MSELSPVDSDPRPAEVSRDPVLDSRVLAGPGAQDGGFAASRALDTVAPEAPFAPLPAAGLILGDYQLLDQVGAGGFSIVMRARHVATGEIVALKMPRVPEFIAHLKREALMSARISDPQVVAIREVRLDLDPPFLVMPYIDGTNLFLQDETPSPPQILEAFRLFRKIVEVVARLHAAGIAHGDLKPGNIRFATDGTCHLLDLGVARQQVAARQLSTLRNSVVSVTGEKIAGTLEYMAPEVMAGGDPVIASDVYALGVILHHLLCGRPPAFGVTPASLNPLLPPGTPQFLRSLLALDPKLRSANAGALLPAIDYFIRVETRCLRRRNGHARRRVFHERVRTVIRGARTLFIAVGVVLVVASAVYAAQVAREETRFNWTSVPMLVYAVPAYALAWLAIVMGMTTINAWYLGVPEKIYKNRTGHPLWNFMMQ